MPVIGFLDSQSRTFADVVLPALRQGLKDNDYVERENIAIEYRWAENQIDQLPALAAARAAGRAASTKRRPINSPPRARCLRLLPRAL
jgi:hypothetical protein